MKLLRAMVPALSAALRAPARLVGRGRALHATAARGAGSGGLFEDATALVGNTPVVKISDKLGAEWKSSFGRPSPSTRRCPRGRQPNSLVISTQARAARRRGLRQVRVL